MKRAPGRAASPVTERDALLLFVRFLGLLALIPLGLILGILLSYWFPWLP